MWERAATLARVRASGRTVVRIGSRQIALFAHGDRIHACSNRCPHEGYPLIEGHLAGDCRLTCDYHNWTFDLASGANVYGGDRRRVYPTRIDGDAVWVDVSEPPPAQRIAATMANLKQAFDDHDYARLARELARLGPAWRGSARGRARGDRLDP